MARHPHARVRRAIAITIQPYEAQEALHTVARARKHLANPKMVKAMKDHLDSMNEAVTGALKPKPVRGGKMPRGGL